MKILSIDFDYFQNVTKEQLHLYPDGIDLNTYMSEIVWGSRYATNGNQLREIKLLDTEYQLLMEVLRKQSDKIPVKITNSHVHIYNFINSIIEKDEHLHIYNIDMHHDIINDNDALDCGNWIGYMISERKQLSAKTTVKWIHNPVSLNVFGLNDVFEQNNLTTVLLDSIERISDEKFDAIFLCRSDNWTVPNIDINFNALCRYLLKHFKSVCIEETVIEPRKLYKEVAKQVKSKIQSAKKDIKNNK